jgi:hypothetical protein
VPKNKTIHWQGTHFIQNSVSVSLIEENEIKIGDKILIRGTTTGEQELIIEEMLVNEVIVEKQLLAIYVPLNYLLESVYQIDCIKSKALFLS